MSLLHSDPRSKDGRNRKIVRRSIMGETPKDLAAEYGISQSRIRQIRDKGIRTIKFLQYRNKFYDIPDTYNINDLDIWDIYDAQDYAHRILRLPFLEASIREQNEAITRHATQTRKPKDNRHLLNERRP